MGTLMAVFGRVWEWLKAVAVVLWPIRFIVLIMLAMIGVLSLPQAKDALYGAVVEQARTLGVFAAVTAWAVQSWYWSRFLLRWPLRRFPVTLYRSRPFDAAFAAPLIVWIPRLLGALVFVIVGMFILAASDSLSGPALAWAALYVFCGVVFLGLTVARRRLLDRPGAVPAAILPSVRAAPSPLGVILAIIWLVLLVLAAVSALVDYRLELIRLPGFEADSRLVLAVVIVAALGITSAILLLRLSLPNSTKGFVAALIVMNVALFLLSIFSAAAAGMWLGPAVVLMLSAGIWVSASSFFLAFPGERLRIPVTTLLILSMLVFVLAPKFLAPVFGHSAGDLDNHRLRTMALLPAIGDPKQDERGNLFDAFEAWRAQAPCLRFQSDHPCRKPMVLVAAQGGASRSGYWVSTILGALEDAATELPFHRSVFAISGVSGGSLGAAAYQRLVARRQSAGTAALCQGAAGPSDSFSVCGQRVLEQDFLGPVFFSMFNADLLQRVLPGDIMPDRGEALETAWEWAWRTTVGTDDFSNVFRIRSKVELEARDGQDWLPLLFLNGASVKTGRRIVTADIAVEPKCRSSDLLYEGADLPSAVDFFCLTRRQIRLSTAVHNSARFPYISPAGTLWAVDSAGHSWKADKIVDGGYVEAQGATTLSDVLSALAAGWQSKGYSGRWDDEVMPIVISIQNDPPEGERDCANAAPEDLACWADALTKVLGEEASTMGFGMQIANDLLAPPIGLASSRTGRGAYAARALAVRLYFQGLGRRPDDRTDGWSAYRLNLRETKGPAPAMSWYLSNRSRRDMASDLCPDVGAPKAEIDDGLRRFGDEMMIADLPGRISSGPGCAALKRRVLGQQ
jgi:hypothetical protein